MRTIREIIKEHGKRYTAIWEAQMTDDKGKIRDAKRAYKEIDDEWRSFVCPIEVRNQIYRKALERLPDSGVRLWGIMRYNFFNVLDTGPYAISPESLPELKEICPKGKKFSDQWFPLDDLEANKRALEYCIKKTNIEEGAQLFLF